MRRLVLVLVMVLVSRTFDTDIENLKLTPLPGDLVNDTPASIAPTYGACNQRVDTCPTKQGLDALSNYMSYTDDACLTKFSSKQTTRVLYNYAQLRWRK